MPIGPYGGAPGFRRMTSPKPAGALDSGAGYYKPDPRPMAPTRPAGTQMFSGAFSAPSDSRRMSSIGGARVTPYENYRAQPGTQDMNRQQFWQSGQAPQYSQVNLMRAAMGQPALTQDDLMAALKRRRQGRGMPGANTGFNSTAPSPFPPPTLNPSFLPGQNGGRPTVSYTLPSTVPPITYPTPPSIQPIPPKSLVIR